MNGICVTNKEPQLKNLPILQDSCMQIVTGRIMSSLKEATESVSILY